MPYGNNKAIMRGQRGICVCSLSAVGGDGGGGGGKKKCICVVNTCFDLTLLFALTSTSSIGINGKHGSSITRNKPC